MHSITKVNLPPLLCVQFSPNQWPELLREADWAEMLDYCVLLAQQQREDLCYATEPMVQAYAGWCPPSCLQASQAVISCMDALSLHECSTSAVNAWLPARLHMSMRARPSTYLVLHDGPGLRCHAACMPRQMFPCRQRRSRTVCSCSSAKVQRHIEQFGGVWAVAS